MTNKSHTQPVTTIQKPPLLFRISKNHLEVTIAMKQHLNEEQTLENNTQVDPRPTTTVLNRPEPSNIVMNLQKPSKTCHNYSKVRRTVVNWLEPPRTCQNNQAVSNSYQHLSKQYTGQARTYLYRLAQARTIQHYTEPSRTIKNNSISFSEPPELF